MIEVLHENEWLSLRVLREPAKGVNGYVYSHESRCEGRIVAVLPNRDADYGREYLIKSEVTPCWSLKPIRSALTGGYEGGEIADDAVRELWEEGGYAIRRSDLIYLGRAYASKSADTLYDLYSVDLTGRAGEEPPGDGSRLESEAEAVWVEAAEIARILDPHVSVMYVRLTALLAASPDSPKED
ncbi:NUDIX domain-containing protein (plasmid) [Nonomuraea sp. CA-143628]|uniref:NUDIX domain-containing protein n=1 Tax=Nonomuraea sp. CA-143628 TaxID=3239997 RepID=UPI003D93C147